MGNQNLKYQFFLFEVQAIVERLDNFIRPRGRITLSNRYPVDKSLQNVLRYLLDSHLSSRQRYPTFRQSGPGHPELGLLERGGRGEGSAKEHEATLQLVGGRGWHPVWEKCKYSQSLHFSDAGLTLTGFDHNTKQQEDNIVLFESGIEQ